MDTADPNTTFQQGLALHQQGRLDEAEAHYRFVLGTQPRHFGALHLTGLVHYQRGNYAAAVDWISRAIEVEPNAAEPHSNLGLALLALLRPEEALASHERALKLKPEVPASLNNRGNALLALNRPLEALADYDRALKWQPNFALAHNNRGNTLRALGRHEEALNAYFNALQFAPDYPDALNNRGRTLRDLKRYDEAAQSFARLLAVAPQQPYAPGMLFASRLDHCDWRNYDASSAAIVAAIERGERADAPFAFFSHATSARAQLDCARLFAAAEYPTSAAPLVVRATGRNERIRLAYVSADFHEHATVYLLAELIERHDRSRFEVTAISYGPDDASAMRARLVAGFDRFVDVREKSDRAAAELIRDAGIDIAIDLKGYTAGNRAGIFAHRGAPVQATYLGFPATMGAPFIDYLIADRHVVPAEMEGAYSEKIVRLPDSYQVNDRRRRIAEATPSRRDAGLPDTGFVFCSFNNSYKIRPSIFDVWMRLLREVEGSVLWLLDDNAAAVANLKAAAEARGIASSRLVFAPRLPLDQHLARHRLADLFLDNFPVNAHTTASDALWAGLPLVTLSGETFVSRVASSLLSAVGLPDLITRTLPDYEALALKLARDPAALARLKAHLQDARATAPLFDTDRFRRHIESAYVTMFERSQKGELPASFDVAPV
jgi:predicted O-linked N-acetylglucosamine transferase (SPINDLY family)